MSREPDLGEIARRVLRDNGFDPELPARLDATIAAADPVAGVRDLRELAWSSIDNAESRDLDQIELAERLPGGAIRLSIGIADVDALVPAGSPIDRRAAQNTTTLYAGPNIFPMLPEALSIDRTSLLGGRDRLAVVTELVVGPTGELVDDATRVYPARVRNQAKLVYEEVGAWLEGDGAPPADPVIAAQLRLQDEAAQRLRARRHERGALTLETIEARPVTRDGRVVDLVVLHKSRARELVEDLMIAANCATARLLERAGRSSIRRVVRAPRRWDRIAALAASHGATLPAAPSAPALAAFLAARRAADPAGFAELSLAVVKLIGPGEYLLQRATDPDVGHFGLAIDDYNHSTAPNRRYPDLVTQRLLKAAAAGAPAAYSDDELTAIAAHCTAREDAARKVERTMRKVFAASFLSARIGEEFDAIVTGAAAKGVFARLVHPPAEGRIVAGEAGLDVGDRIRVRLVDTEPSRGFIDFVRV
jgi:VacB/RNase II family 3'-5' exoribonuclease